MDLFHADYGRRLAEVRGLHIHPQKAPVRRNGFEDVESLVQPKRERPEMFERSRKRSELGAATERRPSV
jgi:hypothetical protein